LSSDDPPLFNTTLCQEYQALVEEFGYSRADLVRLARNAFEVCGAEPPVKARLLQEFDAWVEANEV
jgi:aminodeoxyfutalosine deaminase